MGRRGLQGWHVAILALGFALAVVKALGAGEKLEKALRG